MIKDKHFESGIFIGMTDTANEPILISYDDMNKEPNTIVVGKPGKGISFKIINNESSQLREV